MVRTIVISDIHLGAGNCQAKLLHDFLHSIECERLILNGDIFDNLDFRRLKKQHWKILNTLRKLAGRIEVVWIAGNHDGYAELLSHLLGVKFQDEYKIDTGSRAVLFIHGHQFDDFLDTHPIMTWIGDTVYSFLQWWDKTHGLARWAKKGSKRFLHCAAKIRERASKYAASKGCQVVICGHTHHPEAYSGYYNTGCWTELPCSYLEITGNRIDLNFWKGFN